MPRRRRRNDPWIDALLALGIGFLAVQFVNRLRQGSNTESTRVCSYCGFSSTKWARMCPRCRNTFPI